MSIYQSSVDNKSRLVSVLLKPEEKKEEDTSDSDSGCYLISLEDEEVEDRDRSVSIIPRDNILSGSVLGEIWDMSIVELMCSVVDLNRKNSDMSKQSVGILKRGSGPLEKMKTKLRQSVVRPVR